MGCCMVILTEKCQLSDWARIVAIKVRDTGNSVVTDCWLPLVKVHTQQNFLIKYPERFLMGSTSNATIILFLSPKKNPLVLIQASKWAPLMFLMNLELKSTSTESYFPPHLFHNCRVKQRHRLPRDAQILRGLTHFVSDTQRRYSLSRHKDPTSQYEPNMVSWKLQQSMSFLFSKVTPRYPIIQRGRVRLAGPLKCCLHKGIYESPKLITNK